MTTSALILIGIDLAAALVLSLGLYYRRHHRRDLVVAFLGVNVGVMAVAAVLGTAEVAMGLGLGLFGVLSIIRLRSSEITQREVAYYFAALALGLIGAIVASNIDNVIRPVIYRRVSGLHPMAGLLGAFAGVELFGLLGLVLGPLAIAYCLELIRLYEMEYGAAR